jgi:predicted esterase
MHSINKRDVPTLGTLLAQHSEQIGGAAPLSLTRSPATRVPVFLLHGDNDNVIPAQESIVLRDYLVAAGNSRVDLLLTPLLTHAEARKDVAAAEVWQLVRFWTRLWSAFEQ